MRKIIIEIPDNKELVAIDSVHYELRDRIIPRTWHEYVACKRDDCTIAVTIPTEVRDPMYAFCKLICLRKAWVVDWKPDYTDIHKDIYNISISDENTPEILSFVTHHCLSFPTRKMAEDFAATFRDYIILAKDLI